MAEPAPSFGIDEGPSAELELIPLTGRDPEAEPVDPPADGCSATPAPGVGGGGRASRGRVFGSRRDVELSEDVPSGLRVGGLGGAPPASPTSFVLGARAGAGGGRPTGLNDP